MQYKSILFDLDGTITDSAAGIVHSIAYALDKLGVEPLSQKELYSFIGPPLQESFKKNVHLNETEIRQAVAFYRESYSTQGIYESSVYQGVPELLQELCSLGKTLYIATSKPEDFAKKIVTHFELAPFFKEIYGATLDGKRSDKADVIRYVLKEEKITNVEETIMVGDRRHDITGARENKLASIGVLYGFGDYKELVQAGASYIVSTPNEIEKIIIK